MARILLLTHEFSPFRGGIATVAEGLAAGAAAVGHEMHVLAPDYGRDCTVEDAARPYAVHRFTGDSCSMLSFDKLVRYAWRVRRAVRHVSPDLVHAADPQSQMALTLLARFGPIRNFGFTVHGTEVLRYDSELMPRLWMRGAFGRPAGITVVSHAVRDLLLRRRDVDPSRVSVSYPGIAGSWRERPEVDRRTVRSTWQAGDDDIVLITVARRVPEKGQLRTIEALATLPGSIRRSITYVVVGAGPAEYARSLIRAAGRGGVRVHLAGSLEQDAVIDAVTAADMFVMLSGRTPKRLEGLGLAFLEAGARGVPSIALDTGGAAEAVLDARTGIVLRSSATAAEVAVAIGNLAADPARRSRLGLAAREFAAGFTFERHAAETFEPPLARLAEGDRAA